MANQGSVTRKRCCSICTSTWPTAGAAVTSVRVVVIPGLISRGKALPPAASARLRLPLQTLTMLASTATGSGPVGVPAAAGSRSAWWDADGAQRQGPEGAPDSAAPDGHAAPGALSDCRALFPGREPLLGRIDGTSAGRPLIPGMTPRGLSTIVRRLGTTAATCLRARAKVPGLRQRDALMTAAQRLDAVSPHVLRNSLARRLRR